MQINHKQPQLDSIEKLLKLSIFIHVELMLCVVLIVLLFGF